MEAYVYTCLPVTAEVYVFCFGTPTTFERSDVAFPGDNMVSCTTSNAVSMAFPMLVKIFPVLVFVCVGDCTGVTLGAGGVALVPEGPMYTPGVVCAGCVPEGVFAIWPIAFIAWRAANS